MNYGYLTFNIEKIIADRNISKNQLCKDLDIPRSNFNRYCQNKNTRIDAGFVCKLCNYLNVDVGELITYHPAEEEPKN